MTAEEYLAAERSLEARNEFRDGEMVSLPAQGRLHNLLVGNVAVSLREQLKSSPTGVFMLKMRVRTPDRRFFLYPDVLVEGVPPELDDAEMDTLLNPVVVIQVTSPSTEEYDREVRFCRYQSIPSVTEYILVALDRPFVEQRTRERGERWLLKTLTDSAQILDLPSIGCRLPLTEIYDRVYLP